MHKMFMKLAGAATGVMMMVSTSFTPAQAACGEVTLSQMDWASGIVVTAVSNFLMTNGYGCNVTVVPTATVPAITSVAETGKPDIVTELWLTRLQCHTKNLLMKVRS